MDNRRLIISRLQISAQNLLVILESRSDTIDIGVPKMHSICSKKSLAKSPALVSVRVGIKRIALVLRHTIVKIALNFSPVFLQ